MKKKLFISILIFTILSFILINSVKSVEIWTLLNYDFDTMNNQTFGTIFNDPYNDGTTLNNKKNVYCIHDSAYDSGSADYTMGIYTGDYYYYDKISINTNGKSPNKISYTNVKGTNTSTTSYGLDAAFLSRLFYLSSTSSEEYQSYGYSGQFIYRYFSYYNSSGFNNWLKTKGTFKYAIQNSSPGSAVTSLTNYKKCLYYANFINGLNGKFSIKNKGYNISNAISNKETLSTNVSTSWSINVQAPYYVSDSYYSGVKYYYSFIDSSNYDADDIVWKKATASLVSGGTGNGYKNVKISGNANTNSNANILIIKCSYPTYTGFAMGFATGNGQERFVVNGKEKSYNSYVAYEIEKDPDVRISKTVYMVNADTKNSDTANVEPGDTVIFKVVVENTGAATKVNLTDTIPTGLTFQGVKAKSTDSWSTSWSGLSNVNIAKDGKITRYFKCRVNDNATGTITNTATVSSSKALDESGLKSKKASASVTVLGYSYSLTKTVNKTNVEPGDTITYKIKLTNNNDTHLHKMIMTDTIPEGVDYVSWSASSAVKEKWDVSVSGKTLTFKRKTDKSMGKGSNEFTITCKVSDSAIYTTNKSITNTVYLTQVKNRNGINLTTKNASATITVLGYNYDMTKIVNAIYKSDNKTNTGSTTVAEPGDIVQYKITIKNTGSGTLNNIKVEDIIPSGMTYHSKSSTWSKNGNTYTYNGTLAAGKTLNLYIKAQVNNTVSNTTHTETNIAKITTVENKNSVDITTVKEDSATVTILGYDATLNKYITKHNGKNITGRNTKTNEQKNNSPVIMKKGDTFTYTIVFKNTGTESTTGKTTLYNPQIVDALPAGVEYVSHSNTWGKSGNTYTYNGNVGIGTPVTLEINCRVTMSNMYLFNLENTATYGTVNNRNSVNTTSVLKTEENKDYIRLDELLIAGNVWKDDNIDGLNNSESGIEKVLVYLRDASNDNIVKETVTDSNGNYRFENVEKGTYKDSTTGNYDKDNSKYRQYYVEFVYDGIDYRSTRYTGTNANSEKGQGHLTGNGNYEDDYLIDSNATEIYTDRALINNALETISYNQSNGSEGTIGLEYGKNDNVSTIDKDKLKESIKTILDRPTNGLKDIDANDLVANNIVVNISSYSFMNEDKARDNLWLYPGGTEPITENSLPETDYLQHINLGLTTRDGFDLSLTNKVEEIETVVNGQSMKYDFSNIETIEEFMLYNSDYGFRHDNIQTDLSDAAEEALKNIISGLKQGEASELNIFVTFKTTIKNNSTYAYAKVNEIAQFYDHNFKTYGETVTIGIDNNKDGVMESTQTRETTAYIKGQTGNNIDITNIGTESTITYNDKDLNELKVLYIGTDYNLAPQEEIYIYITYIVDKEGATRDLKINNGTAGFDAQLQYISIIGQYSSYDDASASRIAGLIDDNSNPGNLGLRNNGEGTTEYVKNTEDETKKYDGKQYSEKYFENDTHICGIKFSLDYKRKLSGFTWEDARTETKEDGHRVGNGIFNEDDEIYGKSDIPIGDITIQLVEVIKDGDNYYEVIRQQTTSASDGNYLIEDFIPGNYIVRFRYGNNDTNIDFNGQDYKSTTYTLNPETYETLTQDATISDARDDELRRLEVMNYSLEMYNEKAEILKGIETSNSSELIDKTNMFADTVQFFSDYELLKQASGSLIDKDIISLIKDSIKWDVEGGIEYTRNLDYEIKNIDFGIQERPTSEIELRKYIKQIKLETSAGDLLVDLNYDEAGNLRTDIESKGTGNVQALNNRPTPSPAQQGFRYINVDEDLLQGAKITIVYGFKAINNSQVDHIGANLYGEQSIVDKLNTAQVLQGMVNAINELDNLDTIDETTVEYEIRKNNYKYRKLRTGGTYSYGYYLGGIYYTGTKTDDVIATIKVDNILDYVDNSMVFSPLDNGGTWGTALEKELIIEGYLNPNVATYINASATNEADKIKTFDELKLEGYQYREDETTGTYWFEETGGITFEGSILDINHVGYQTISHNGVEGVNVKNNLAITIDDPTLNAALSKQLYPNGTGDSEATTELMVSTYLSSENESDDMVYENIAEIIKFTTLTGRRTVSIQTVGNAKMSMAGYIDDDPEGTLREPDTSITEKVMLTPPTGADWIDTYILTRVIIYVVGSVGVVVLGILFIPKLVTKIKNRKFIK